MSVTTFDKLAYLEALKSAGIPEAQARAHALALENALRDSVATRTDIKRLERKIEAMEQRMTIKFGGLIVAGIAFPSAITFFGH